MAEQTLLEMTQNILSRLDSDEVNSISDTVESTQVAKIIQNKYYDILTRGALPEQQVLYQLDPSNNSSKPTLMYVPSGAAKMDWIKYFDSNPNDNLQQDQFGSYSHGLNTDLVSTTAFTTTSTTSNSISIGSKTFVVASSSLPITVGQGVTAMSGTNSMFGTVTSYSGTTLIMTITTTVGSGTFTSWTITSSLTGVAPGYKYVTQMAIDQFLDYVNQFNPASSNVGSFTFTEGAYSFTFYFMNDIQPRYCTVIENRYVIFDAYNNLFDSTLQASKTLVAGQKVTPFQLVDSFIPDIDDNQFPLLLNEATSLAFYELKQMPHVKADQEIKRQWSTVQKNKSVSNRPSYFDELGNFGRVPRTGGYSSGGYGMYKWMRGT